MQQKRSSRIIIDQISVVIDSVVSGFAHIWPYLAITIPLAVAVQMSGAARYINRALETRPFVAILLATIVGAFSPFCSCGVIPVIASLLIGGVPLAPVMSFWIASPSMDPEIFFLSVATIGWDLAVWRLVATLILSLAAGFITHVIMQRGWLEGQILRTQQGLPIQNRWNVLDRGLHSMNSKWRLLKDRLTVSLSQQSLAVANAASDSQKACCTSTASVDHYQLIVRASIPDSNCASGYVTPKEKPTKCGRGCNSSPVSFSRRLFNETGKATAIVVKFMVLAFFLKALITLYVPSEWIAGLLGNDNTYSILTAVLIGIPVYASNLTALPMVGALLAQGMNPGAALAFLIAGSVTTLPAMGAVWGITSRRVFALYLSFSLIGALISGYIYTIIA